MPFICPPGGVPEGAVPFIPVHPGVYLKVRCCLSVHPTVACRMAPHRSRRILVSVGVWVDDETELSLHGMDVRGEFRVQPATMIRMRMADAIDR